MKNIAAFAAVVLGSLGLAPLLHADDNIGIFETIHESSVSFSETNTALEQAIAESWSCSCMHRMWFVSPTICIRGKSMF